MKQTVAAHLPGQDCEAIRKLAVTGVKMLVQQPKAGRETDRRLDRRAAGHEIRSLERGSNGHGPKSN